MAGISGPSRPTREELPPDAPLCDYCTGKCCRYLALPIATPEDWKDYDEIRWYLAHEDVSVFVDKGTWYLMVQRVCRHLQADHRCGIYTTRPRICRNYTTADCEYDDDFSFEKIFEHDAQIWEYAEALLGPPVASGVLAYLGK